MDDFLIMMNKSDIRILYINSSPGWGGMEMHPLIVAEELSRRGLPLLFAMRHNTPACAHGKGRGYAYVELPFRWYFTPGAFSTLQRMVKSFRINVIHVHYSRDTWRALLLAGILRKRAVLIFSKHMGSPETNKKDDFLHRLLVRRLDAMIAISDYIRSNILETYPIEASKVKVIPYGLGPAARGTLGGAGEMRNRLGVPPGVPLIGMVAQVSPDKRQDLFIRAAKRVSASFPGCRFVMVGAETDSGYSQKVSSLVSDLGLESCLHIAGFMDDIPSLMQALDIFVLPSKEEAFGLVLLEAMANGKPVVGSRSGAVPEIVRHEETGLLFEPGNPESLAAALLDLLRSPDKREYMGRQGARVFDERFRLEREASDTETLYRSLLSD